ncbi:hypothetical protein B0H13DRAFT_1904435 [Mycena leptocephala]|nr:hypothetical protein B0H13DRAFT_1904435 [Mycena leptocephala]
MFPMSTVYSAPLFMLVILSPLFKLPPTASGFCTSSSSSVPLQSLPVLEASRMIFKTSRPSKILLVLLEFQLQDLLDLFVECTVLEIPRAPWRAQFKLRNSCCWATPLHQSLILMRDARSGDGWLLNIFYFKFPILSTAT